MVHVTQCAEPIRWPDRPVEIGGNAEEGDGVDMSNAPAVVMALRCPCGLEVHGVNEARLIAHVTTHLADAHPNLVGRYADEDILSLAHRKPVSAALGAGALNRLEH